MTIKLATMLAAMTLAVAPAEAACWAPHQVSAARVRDMQTMLMVAALRCRAGGHDLLPAYNAFVTANRTRLQGINDVIKARFRGEAGPVAGQAAYDRFTTSLANAYGSGASGPAECDAAAALAQEGAAAESADMLAALAGRSVFGTPVEACPAPALALAPPAAPAATPQSVAPVATATIAGVTLASAIVR